MRPQFRKDQVVRIKEDLSATKIRVGLDNGRQMIALKGKYVRVDANFNSSSTTIRIIDPNGKKWWFHRNDLSIDEAKPIEPVTFNPEMINV